MLCCRELHTTFRFHPTEGRSRVSPSARRASGVRAPTSGWKTFMSRHTNAAPDTACSARITAAKSGDRLAAQGGGSPPIPLPACTGDCSSVPLEAGPAQGHLLDSWGAMFHSLASPTAAVQWWELHTATHDDRRLQAKVFPANSRPLLERVKYSRSVGKPVLCLCFYITIPHVTTVPHITTDMQEGAPSCPGTCTDACYDPRL